MYVQRVGWFIIDGHTVYWNSLKALSFKAKYRNTKGYDSGMEWRLLCIAAVVESRMPH